MNRLAFLIPYLPFISSLLVLIVPIYLMRLQAKKLKAEIAQIKVNIDSSKSLASKDQATALETLERVTATTADELEKSLQKSITMRNLMEQVSQQNTLIGQQQDVASLQTSKLDKLTIELASEHAARVELEEVLKQLREQLATERAERQTAIAEIDRLKVYSEVIVQKLTTRVRNLEAYIKKNNLPIPNGVQQNE